MRFALSGRPSSAAAGSVIRLPVIEELRHIARLEMAHAFEFAMSLGEQDLSFRREHDQRGHATFERYAIVSGDVRVCVVASDVDVNEFEVLLQELLVGGIVEVDIENLAVAAPVAAEVEDHALVLCFG